jgi:amino acid adenylation domain-containing protein
MAEVLHALLERAARNRPGHPAVSDGGRVATYAELDQRADALAGALVDMGVRRGDRVGVLLEKSIDAVACLYGVMKAGAAYVPLDPRAPGPRLAQVLADCDVRCVLGSGDPVGGVEVLDAAAVPPTSRGPVAAPVASEDLAYILYTSGSTGAPKGVMVSHANALAFVRWTGAAFGVTGDDRLSSHAPFHFDLSVFDLYAAAAAAATVVLVPPEASVFPAELRRFVAQERITVWYSVPSVLTQLASRARLSPGDLPSLRAVLFAGEVFPTRYLRQLMSALPHARFANLYGPTETNVCTWYEVDRPPEDDRTIIPIGRPIEATRVAVVGDDGRPGELYVQGPTVAQGYWNDAARTAARFVTDPRPDLPGRWYRTGDLVEEAADGNLRFLGRGDGQIKSRGYRIELGDVEATVYAHPAVVDCAVVAVPDELVTARLHAFAVVDGDVAGADLARFCTDRLPRYMVPETFELCPALPRTATGKVDRRALEKAALTPAAKRQ